MEINNEGRVCGKCSQFKIWEHYNKNPKGARGFKSICKVCHLENARVLKLSKDPEEVSYERHLKKLRLNYGLTQTQYDEILTEQEGGCAICGVLQSEIKDKWLSVDHCHSSGKVRGLLCRTCNSGLGKLGDTVQGLEKALQYLKKNNQRGTV